jgi:hypothetical protein
MQRAQVADGWVAAILEVCAALPRHGESAQLYIYFTN